jgi:hypothetical protein
MQVSKIIRINQIWFLSKSACNILTISVVIMCLNLGPVIFERCFRMSSKNFHSENTAKM